MPLPLVPLLQANPPCCSSLPPCLPACPSDPSGSIQSLVKLQQLLADAGSEPWAYAWLPPPALAAIGNLLHASLLRRCGG